MTDLTRELIDPSAPDDTRFTGWLDLAPRRGERRRTASADTGPSPFPLGPFEGGMAVIVAMLALPVLVVTLMGCALAYALRAFAGGGHG